MQKGIPYENQHGNIILIWTYTKNNGQWAQAAMRSKNFYSIWAEPRPHPISYKSTTLVTRPVPSPFVNFQWKLPRKGTWKANYILHKRSSACLEMAKVWSNYMWRLPSFVRRDWGCRFDFQLRTNLLQQLLKKNRPLCQVDFTLRLSFNRALLLLSPSL
jgi:hypothetical protein